LLNSEGKDVLLDSQERGHDRVLKLGKSGFGPNVNGWQFGPPFHGNWGEHFLQRAYGVFIGGM
jgi:hypothetical protein